MKYIKLFCLFIPLLCNSQIGFNSISPDASAALDINSRLTTTSFGGLKLPVVADNVERNLINVSSNDTGLLIFNQASNCIEIYDAENGNWVVFDACSTPSFLFQETFETDGNTLTGGTRYTTSVAEYLAGGDDFFTRIDYPSFPTGLSGTHVVNTPEGDFYFGAIDLDSEGGSSQQDVTFTAQLDISSLTAVNLQVLLGEDDASDNNQDWDGSDFFHIQIRIDGGAWQTVLAVEADGSLSATPRIDTNLDGIGDGAEITDTFQEFSTLINVTGNVLELRLLFNLDSGDEDIAVDNIRLSAN